MRKRNASEVLNLIDVVYNPDTGLVFPTDNVHAGVLQRVDRLISAHFKQEPPLRIPLPMSRVKLSKKGDKYSIELAEVTNWLVAVKVETTAFIEDTKIKSVVGAKGDIYIDPATAIFNADKKSNVYIEWESPYKRGVTAYTNGLLIDINEQSK